MKRDPDNRESLRQELLEFYFDCHPDPEGLEARLAEDAAVAALYEEVRRTAALLEGAAHEEAPPLDLAPPVETGSTGRRVKTRGPRMTFRRVWYVAAAVVVLALTPAFGMYVYRAWQEHEVEQNNVRLIVSAPPAVPDGSPLRFHVETHNLVDEKMIAQVDWKVLGEDGATLTESTTVCEGATDITVAGSLNKPRKLVVTATVPAAGFTKTVEQVIHPAKSAPLVHLTSDKPAYRPGEEALLRIVCLDRLTLRGADHIGLRCRILDPRDGVVRNTVLGVGKGVAAWSFPVPATAVGGTYALEVRDHKDEFTLERYEFLVRNFQPPKLKKKIILDRQTYAAGASGSASLQVTRATGGPAAGAKVQATLLVDGDERWQGQAELDGDGRAVFEFQVPAVVMRGAARFVAKVTDGGNIETTLQPFVIPTDKVEAHLFPESGVLVAGAENRVYAQLRDPLGRPLSGAGRVMDDSGVVVAQFRTAHMGRGRFVFTPVAGRSYKLELTEPKAKTVDLPEVAATGVVLQTDGDFVAAGQPAKLRVHASGTGPFLAAAFCRGVLVGQQSILRPGLQQIDLPLVDEASGVLRVTVFDRELRPVAERLVKRDAKRNLTVQLTPAAKRTTPGSKQRVTVRTTDETGETVSCIVGLSVTDRRVADMLDSVRIGLADQQQLWTDVEKPDERVDEFLTADAAHRRNVDLLLGSLGWRRYVWQGEADSEALVLAGGEWAKALPAREGRSWAPVVTDTLVSHEAELRTAAWSRSEAWGWVIGFAEMALWLFGLLGLVHGMALIARRLGSPRPILVGSVCGALAMVMLATMVKLKPAIIQSLGVEWSEAPTMAAMPDPREDGGVVSDYGDFHGFRKSDGKELPILFDFTTVPEGALGTVSYIKDFDVERDAVNLFAFGLDGLHFPSLPTSGLRTSFDTDRSWSSTLGGQVRTGSDEFFMGRGVFGHAPNLFSENGKNLVLRYGQVEARQRLAVLTNLLNATRAYKHAGVAGRSSFAETLFWKPLLLTDEKGEATVEFDVSDSITTFQIHADAHGTGRVGQGTASFESFTPFHMDPTVPTRVSEGDVLHLPVSIVADDATQKDARVQIQAQGPFELKNPEERTVALREGRGRVLAELVVGKPSGAGTVGALTIRGRVGNAKDIVQRRFVVVPRGFPHASGRADKIAGSTGFSVQIPDELAKRTAVMALHFYPSPIATIEQGLEGMLREPHGCFEQVSSSNYPNVMVLSLLEASGDNLPAAASKARKLLASGYKKLAGYECADGGFDWWGKSPGHAGLTAYGLMQFADMASVFEVDREMVVRTRQWLLRKRDGEGGFVTGGGKHGHFMGGSVDSRNAYIAFALLYSGEDAAGMKTELDHIEKRAKITENTYELAVLTCALAEADRSAAAAACKRLVARQEKDGSMMGSASIMGSGKRDLRVETTSFATLACLACGGHDGVVQRAVRFLEKSRLGSGRFGGTQATVMALKAVSAYASANTRTVKPGALRILVGGKEVANRKLFGSEKRTITFDRLATHLGIGGNEVRIELTGGNEFPFSMELGFRADLPASHPDCALDLSTWLTEAVLREGDTTAVHAEVHNKTDAPVANPLVVIGLPAGLHVSAKILDDLKKAERIAAWELLDQEIILYLRGLEAGERRDLVIDTTARIPGTTKGAASRAWLYYAGQQRKWTDPLVVTVTPGR